MALANRLKPREKAKTHCESGGGKPLPAKPESCIQRKIVVPSMTLFPPPAKVVEPAYRAKILIPTAIK
jgi:hypothetical protein